jgi:hypothetical protein
MKYRNEISPIKKSNILRDKLYGLLLSIDLALIIILLQYLNELVRLKNIIRLIQ